MASLSASTGSASSRFLDCARVSGTVSSYLEEDDDPDFVEPIVYRFFREIAKTSSDSSSSSPVSFLHCSQRSSGINREISHALGAISGNYCSSWKLFNGSPGYDLCGIPDERLLKRLILQAAPSQKDFYVLELGAGNFQLGAALSKYINAQTDLPPGITVHMISVRGEQNIEKTLIKEGCCIRYNLGGVKIEELDTELDRRGLSIKGKLDLVETSWCCRHLVDPVGTFTQCFDWLRPGSGLFLGDGFFFLLENESDPVIGANPRMIQLLLDLESPFLMQHYDGTRSLNRFIIKKIHSDPCALPMRYLRLDHSSEYGDWYQIKSNCVTQFSRIAYGRSRREINLPQPGWACGFDGLYGSKSLFNWLKTHELIRHYVRWQPILRPEISSASIPSPCVTAVVPSPATPKKEALEPRLEKPALSRNALADVVKWIKKGDCVILHNAGRNGHFYCQDPHASVENMRVITLDIAASTYLLDEREWPFFIEKAGCKFATDEVYAKVANLSKLPYRYSFRIGY